VQTKRAVKRTNNDATSLAQIFNISLPCSLFISLEWEALRRAARQIRGQAKEGAKPSSGSQKRSELNGAKTGSVFVGFFPGP
jgi:hypothetical protein